jgi:hypothetical protein
VNQEFESKKKFEGFAGFVAIAFFYLKNNKKIKQKIVAVDYRINSFSFLFNSF